MKLKYEWVLGGGQRGNEHEGMRTEGCGFGKRWDCCYCWHFDERKGKRMKLESVGQCQILRMTEGEA